MYLIFLIILLVVIYHIFNINIINYNVITLKNKDRIENIISQEFLYNIKINMFDAIKGGSINQQKLFNNNILDSKFMYPSIKRSNEIGCYMSHLNLLKKCMYNNFKYSVIFEDDFTINNEHFYYIINDALYQLPCDFDLLFLGYPSIIDDTTNKKYSKNLYKLNLHNNIHGAYGYLINNKNLNKVIEQISFIDMPIDIKYQELGYANKLNIFFLSPKVIDTNFKFTSTIVT